MACLFVDSVGPSRLASRFSGNVNTAVVLVCICVVFFIIRFVSPHSFLALQSYSATCYRANRIFVSA